MTEYGLVDSEGAEAPGDEFEELDVSDTEADRIARERDREFAQFRERIKDADQFKVEASVFDDATYAALYRLVQHGAIDAMGGPISTGKEANVYTALGGPQSRDVLDVDADECEVAIKVYRINASDFRDMREYLTGDLLALPRGLVMPFDHAADTAAAHVLAMERGTPGEEYIVAGEPRNVLEVFDLAEELTGVPRPRAVPDAVFGWLARAVGLLERVVTPPRGYESELLSFAAGRKYDVDNSKAARDLGVEHRPLAEGLREYLSWEIDRMGLDVDVE